ncbi:MAG: penicillin-binding protein 2 [Candidatus Andersenbacteria bacterium CG10_big_fil_rev_8_21_14_0_10_54_11]|uniref:Penicillin-binding protein 2 n=1 Tax=Candidatus Andersenbacteria bacterium CG10_big_fil_rev_8_21_14_0_10_54_11 TaxID=1974485 RepID=A0A2M6WYI0_9BACT|nr:MAG: penicillin-binding protein 2 [Candidatus Andersenbacteria bacterium CG10_big_fil_rev_8_21_14_0_10_54_11]
MAGMSDTIIEMPRAVPATVRQRPGFLVLLLASSATILLLRTFYLQVVRGGQFHVQAEGNRVAVTPLQAPRGIMYDRFEHPVTENVASTNVLLDPGGLPAADESSLLLDRLPELLGIAPEEVQAAAAEARREQRDVLLLRALPHDDVLAVEAEQHNLPGVKLSSAIVRKYPFGYSLAHVLGYASAVTAKELAAAENLYLADITGKSGLELTYDKSLRGKTGAAYMEITADNNPTRPIETVPPLPGADFFLTLDAELQQFAFNLLAEHVSAQAPNPGTSRAGAIVALDPRSGAVRALASYPSFDPNTFSLPGQRDGAAAVLTDPQQPLLDRAISGTYPPGSTIKPLLAVGGLAAGVITPETVVFSSGGITVGPWHFPDWKAGGHGRTDVVKALADSVNTFFYRLAGGTEDQPGLGVDRLGDYLRAFGWGAATGIDLPSESAGLIPTPAWKERERGEPWFIGDTYHLAIGQGDVLATPLQVAVSTAAVANGGIVHQPYLVERQLLPDGEEILHQPHSRQVPARPEDFAVVRTGMRAAVTEGSARSLAALPIPIAGKTGTAQFGSGEQTHAWFTSFGPTDDPELVITILLDAGGAGDEAAVPLTNELWRWWAENRAAGGS